MSETEYPNYRMKIVGKILDPSFKYLYDRHITVVVIPFVILSVYMYFLFRKRPKGKTYTAEEILVVIGWLFCIVLGIFTQYIMLTNYEK